MAPATAAGSGSGRASSGALLAVRPALEGLPELEAGEATNRHVDPKAYDRLPHDVADRPVALLDERLLEQTLFLVEALDLPLDDALDHLLGLALLARLRGVDLPLGRELGRRDVLAPDVARRGRRHLQRQVVHEPLELGRLGDEVGLAVHLDEDADLPARVDVGADRTVGGCARRLLRRLGEPALAQQTERALEVAAALRKRLLAVEEAGAGALAQVLDELEAHGCGPSTASAGASTGTVPAPSPGSCPAPRWRSSQRLRPSTTAPAIAPPNRRRDRNAELVRLADRDLLLRGVDHEERVGELAQPPDAAERGEQLVALAAEALRLLLRDRLRDLRVLEHLVEFLQALDRLLDRLEVGEGAAEPARVHVERPAALGLLADHVLRLLLGADEEHLPALGRQVANEVVGFPEHLHRLLEVDDVDAVARAEDVRLHLRVPAAGLVPEVHAGLEQVLHGDVGHGRCSRIGPPFTRE